MGKVLSNYVNQLERDLHKKRDDIKPILPGTMSIRSLWNEFPEEFSKRHIMLLHFLKR